MPLLLRHVKKRRWDHDGKLNWLPESEIPADALADLCTLSNSLSLWLVEDDESNLVQFVAAIASTRDVVAQVDYMLLDQRHLSQLGISVEESPGNSPLSDANAWHRDLTHLSAQKLLDLAKVMWNRGRTGRKLPKAVEQSLVDAVRSGRIDPARLKDLLRVKILTHTGTYTNAKVESTDIADSRR